MPLVFDFFPMPNRFGYGMRVGERHGETVQYIANEISFRPYHIEDDASPCMFLNVEDAQALADGLWRAGFFRSTEERKSPRERQYHPQRVEAGEEVKERGENRTQTPLVPGRVSRSGGIGQPGRAEGAAASDAPMQSKE
jgi:hypothetical protein